MTFPPRMILFTKFHFTLRNKIKDEKSKKERKMISIESQFKSTRTT